MNIQQLNENINKHKFHKSQYFSTQSLIVVEYILSKTLKYGGEFFELISTISEQTGVSVSTIKRTTKRMEELEIISVQPRRSKCEITGKTLQSSNLIKVLDFKEFKGQKIIVVGDVRESVSTIETVDHVAETSPEVTTIPQPRRSYTKKPVRVEVVPDWLGTTYVPPVETDEVKRQREELIKQLRGVS